MNGRPSPSATDRVESPAWGLRRETDYPRRPGRCSGHVFSSLSGAEEVNEDVHADVTRHSKSPGRSQRSMMHPFSATNGGSLPDGRTPPSSVLRQAKRRVGDLVGLDEFTRTRRRGAPPPRTTTRNASVARGETPCRRRHRAPRKNYWACRAFARARVAKSTMPSMMMTATWTPAGQRLRAIDSARLR